MGQQGDALDLLAKRYGSTSSDTSSVSDMDLAALRMKYAGYDEVPKLGPEEPPSVMGFLKNIPTSAGRTIQNATSLLDPETYAGMYRVGKGMFQKAAPESFGFGQENVPQFDAAASAMGERYGHPLKTLYNDPVGGLVDLAALASGAGGLARGAAGVGSRVGMQLPNVARAGEIAGQVGEAINPLAWAAKGASKVANVAGRTAMGGMGLMTGRGKATGDLWDTMDNQAPNTRVDGQGNAIPKGMPTSTAAMRGRITEIDSVENMKSALEMAKQKRINEYQNSLQQWQSQHGNRDLSAEFTRVEEGFYDKLGDFRIRRSAAGETPDQYLARNPGAPTAARGTPEFATQDRAFSQWQQEGLAMQGGEGGASRLDFKGSGISPNSEAGARILEMDKLFQEWRERYPNPTAMDMDLLKRSVDAMYSVDSRARQIVAATKSSLRGEIERAIPGYKQMTQRYHEASNFIEQFESEFSLANKNPGVAVRKMAIALNQSNDFRKSLTLDLNEISPGLGDRMTAEMAGHAFSGYMPKGLIGNLGGLGLAGRTLHNPVDPTNLMIGMTSPRVIGEGLTALKGAKIPEVVEGFMKAPANPIANVAARAASGEVGYEPRRIEQPAAGGPTSVTAPPGMQQQAPAAVPQKNYLATATDPKTGHKMGTMDGVTWEEVK